MMVLATVGALAYGVLFLAIAAAAAIVTGSKIALGLVLLASALAFFAFVVQLAPNENRSTAAWLGGASWLVAALAALRLLF